MHWRSSGVRLSEAQEQHNFNRHQRAGSHDAFTGEELQTLVKGTVQPQIKNTYFLFYFSPSGWFWCELWDILELEVIRFQCWRLKTRKLTPLCWYCSHTNEMPWTEPHNTKSPKGGEVGVGVNWGSHTQPSPNQGPHLAVGQKPFDCVCTGFCQIVKPVEIHFVGR